MKFNKIGFYSVILAIIIAISIGVPLYIRYKRTIHPLISINSYDLNPRKGEERELNITTDYVSSPCWELKLPKIKISKNVLSITIDVFVRFNPKAICPGIVVTYDVQILVVFPSIGNWTVQCNNELIAVYVAS